MAAARTYIEMESKKMPDTPFSKCAEKILERIKSDQELEEEIVYFRVLFAKFAKSLGEELKYSWQWMMIEIAMFDLLENKKIKEKLK